MKQSDPLQSYYDTQCEALRRLIAGKCKTAGQRAAVSAMALERCNMQFAFLEKHLPALSELAMYPKILAGMEQLACGGGAVTPEMGQEYGAWCLRIEEAMKRQSLNGQSYWQLQLLPGMIEKLGTFFAGGTPPYWDDVEISLIGVWLLFWYETKHKYPNPGSFNFYAFIRSRHPDIDAIGKQRDELRIKLSKSVKYSDAYDAISDTYKKECRRYWGEAAAERKRLIENQRPVTVESLALTPMELDRIRADVRFIAEEAPAREDIRRRLQYYRTLDIASE